MANVGVWTNNWRGLKNSFLLGRYYEGLTTYRRSNGNTPSDGTTVTSFAGPFANATTTLSSTTTTVLVGSSSTPPAASDITVTEINGISYLTVANEGIDYDTSTGTATKTIKLTIQNQSNADVTIREWGLFGGSNPSSVSHGILLYREVLENPVTLAVNQSATLSVTLSITLADPV